MHKLSLGSLLSSSPMLVAALAAALAGCSGTDTSTTTTSSGSTSASTSSGSSSGGSSGGSSSSGSSTGSACTPIIPTDLPATLIPDAGGVALTATLQLVGIGTQNYTCVFGDDGGLTAVWSAAVPAANLYFCTDAGAQVGTHFGGPTWEWTADSSTFEGDKVHAVKAGSPDDAGYNIPWLLLPKLAGTDAGMFGPVLYVQRVNTQGGVLPAGSACDPAIVAAGGAPTMMNIPYAATYLFYE